MRKNLLAVGGSIMLSLVLASCAQNAAPAESTTPATVPSAPQKIEDTHAVPAITQALNAEASLSITPSSEQTSEGAGADQKNVKVLKPLAGEKIGSPLKLEGTAQNWYFEGTFPVRLENDKGEVLAAGQAHALEEWTKGGWIPYEAELEFGPGSAQRGKIILENDNPSGMPENAESYTMEVTF